jgi:hypothetical protein
MPHVSSKKLAQRGNTVKRKRSSGLGQFQEQEKGVEFFRNDMGLSKGPLEEDLYIFIQRSSEDSTYSYQDRAFIIHEKSIQTLF